MASNTSLSVSSLDFDTLKNNLLNYLTNQSVFKDYNFNGSNLNVLTDLLSYNTYLNAFYLNMVMSEMFLDSAQRLNSVISHAKELNYLPQSAKSSTAEVSFNINFSNNAPSSITINKGTLFSGQNSNGSFIFSTDRAYGFTSITNTFNCSNVVIFEGQYTTDVFVVDYSTESQKFVLSNPNIDISSLIVTVNESGENTIFASASTLLGLTGNSNVFFPQAAQNGQYEIVFGDNIFGRYPKNLSIITCNYRVSKGHAADGISSFTPLGTAAQITGYGGASSISSFTITANSTGGAPQESIESIRFSAPRYFATQQRAITTDDFAALILDNYSGIIKDVHISGGETLPQKQYGSVVVTLLPSTGTVATDFIKNEVASFLKNYVSLPTKIITSDPEYLFIGIKSTVQYDPAKTIIYPTDITNKIITNIVEFSNTNLQSFAGDFRYSQFIKTIDAADPSIISNQTEVSIIKRLAPLVNYPTSYNIYLNNPIYSYNITENAIVGYTKGQPFYDEPVVTSTPFTYSDAFNNQYPLSYIRDDNYGTLVVYTFLNGSFTILNSALGTVDYTNGIIIINNLKTSSYNDYISLYIAPKNSDVINFNKILKIDSADVNISVVKMM